jgi:glycosyltransferase involved in cell wall biosynthesis
MRVGVYNRHLPTLGGGERYSLAIAACLGEHQAVEVISHTPVSRDTIAERLQIDLGAVRLRVVPERPAGALTSLSAEYDFFVNASNLDFIPPQARYSAMAVYFPSPPARGAVGGLRRRLRQELAQSFLIGTFREGVYGADARGVRLLGPRAVIELPPGAGGHDVFFRLRSTLPVVQQVIVAVDGTPTLSLAVGAEWVACRLSVPHSRGLSHSVAIHAEAVATVAGARSAGHDRSTPFALEMDGWAVGDPRNEFYRRWFVRRLPQWDSRLRNPQPDDTPSVAAAYTLVWSISQFTQRWVKRYWGLQSQLLFPPVDVERFAAAPPALSVPSAAKGAGARQPFILSVGRFFAGQHNKRHLAMIAAFRRLVNGGLRGWDLRLVGGLTPGPEHAGYLEQVRAAAQGYPIHIEVGLPFTELVDRYRAAAIYWHAAGYGEDEERRPIAAEHFGITTVEAMAAGCVPVVIAHGGQVELVTHGANGYLWRTLDELCTHTQALIGDPAKRTQMASAAQASAVRFDAAHFAERLAETLAAARIPARVTANAAPVERAAP